jgi:hypothetical protein
MTTKIITRQQAIKMVSKLAKCQYHDDDTTNDTLIKHLSHFGKTNIVIEG